MKFGSNGRHLVSFLPSVLSFFNEDSNVDGKMSKGVNLYSFETVSRISISSRYNGKKDQEWKIVVVVKGRNENIQIALRNKEDEDAEDGQRNVTWLKAYLNSLTHFTILSLSSSYFLPTLAFVTHSLCTLYVILLYFFFSFVQDVYIHV